MNHHICIECGEDTIRGNICHDCIVSRRTHVYIQIKRRRTIIENLRNKLLILNAPLRTPGPDDEDILWQDGPSVLI